MIQALVINDFAFTYDREGIIQSLLRVFLTEYPTEHVQSGSTVTCKAWGENTSTDNAITINSWIRSRNGYSWEEEYGDYVYPRGHLDERHFQSLEWSGIESGEQRCSVKYFGTIGDSDEEVLLAEVSFIVIGE